MESRAEAEPQPTHKAGVFYFFNWSKFITQIF
jgi:hypothetical protein